MRTLTHRTIILVAVAAAGLTAAISLTVAPSAKAWDWHSLPSGYGVSSYQLVCHTATDDCLNGDGSTCDVVTITAPNASPGQLSVQDCSDPSFQSEIDSFVDATICAVNPSADPGRCAPPPTTTAAPPATTTQATTTTTASTTTSQGATTAPSGGSSPTGSGGTATTATATPAGPTTTVTQTVTVEDPTVQQQLTELQQRLAVDEARISALEQKNGQILGEQKNEPPFTVAR